MKLPFSSSKPKIGKLTIFDWAEVRALVQKEQYQESCFLLLSRAYDLTDKQIEKLSKADVHKLLAKIEGITEGFVCTNCGGPLGKLLCEKCVTFEANRKQIADELLQAATEVVQHDNPK